MKTVVTCALLTGVAALNVQPQSLGRRAFVATAAGAYAQAATAYAPHWDKDYIGTGAEKNALSDYEVVAMQQAPPGKIDV